MNQKQLKTIKTFVRQTMRQTSDQFHGFQHAQNVARNSLLLWSLLSPSQAATIDPNLLQACAYLHDLHTVHYPASFKNFLFESRLIKSYLPPILNQFNLNQTEKKLIYQTILHHPLAFPFHRLNRHRSLYAQLLQDADFLDQFNPQRLQLLQLETKPTLFHHLKTFLVNFNQPNTVRWLIRHFANNPDLAIQAYNYRWHHFQYVESGDPTNPTILFLHGYADSIYTFLPTINQLSTNYHLLALELPFHQKHATYGLNEILSYIHSFLASKHLDQQPITLSGFSLGGLIAGHYATKYPQQIKRLIFLNSTPPPDSLLFNLSTTLLFYLLKIPLISRLITFINLNFFATFRRLQHDWFSYFNLRHFSRSIHQTTVRILKDGFHQPNLLQQLQQLNIDIQAVFFEDDLIIPPKYAHTFHHFNIPFTTFPCGGHADKSQSWNLALIHVLRTNHYKR